MKTTWVLVAGNSHARIFDWQSRDVLEEIKTFSHPEGRLQEQELVTDKPGRGFGGADSGRHAQEPPSAKEHESQIFAGELVAVLEENRARNKFVRLVVIAGPQFLGQLRDKMPAELQKLVILDISKNLAQQPVEEIRRCLPDTLPV